MANCDAPPTFRCKRKCDKCVHWCDDEPAPVDNPLDFLVRMAPFSAKMMPFGAPVWFVENNTGNWVCQVSPSTDEALARGLAELLNKGAGIF